MDRTFKIPSKFCQYPRQFSFVSKNCKEIDFGKYGKVSCSHPFNNMDVNVCNFFLMVVLEEKIFDISTICEEINLNPRKNGKEVRESINKIGKAKFRYEKCFNFDGDFKLVLFKVKKKKVGRRQLFVIRRTPELSTLFDKGSVEFNFDKALCLSPLERRVYEFAKYKSVASSKDWSFTRWLFWLPLKDSNKARAIGKIIDALFALYKKKLISDIGIRPSFKEEKDPAHQSINQSEGRDKKLNESAGITQTRREVNANKQAAFAKSAQQPTHEHFKQPVKNCDTSQGSLMEIQALVNKMRKEFQGRSIDFDPSLIWDMVLGNIITETQAKERFDIFFRAWTVIKGREAYKIKSEFGNFGGAIRSFFKDGKDWFSKYIQKREAPAVKRDPAIAQQQEAENNNKRAAFFNVWDKNISAKYKAYKQTVEKYGVMKNWKLFAKCIAEEFVEGVFRWEDKSLNFLREEELEKISEYIEQRSVATSGVTNESRRKGVG